MVLILLLIDRIFSTFGVIILMPDLVQMAQGVTSRDLMLVLQKQLSPSGVSSLGRIVLPKVSAELSQNSS